MTLTTIVRRGGLLMIAGFAAFMGPDAGPFASAVRLAAPSHRQVPIIIRERRNSVTTSSNWSGYAVTGSRNSVTDVKGSWIVPAVTGCSSTNQYSSFWIGIDGYNSNTVEQIGTDSDCQGGIPTYYAWYEFYPHWFHVITLNAPILPGDTMSAEVKYSGGMFIVSLSDVNTGQSFSLRVKMTNARLSSAEWIAEAPWSGGVQALANFDTVNFGANFTNVPDTSSATVGGVTASIGKFGSPTQPSSPVQQITMTSGSGAAKAQPSDLSNDGSSFSIQWLNAGP